MFTQWQEYLDVRPATEAEVQIFDKVDLIFTQISDEMFDNIMEDASEWLMTIGRSSYNARKRLARKAKKLNLTVKEIETWYFIDRIW